ncbi:hypothetical protein FG167_15495 [Lacinutrix sp. WUR7]|uniref:hypothetical protein n=1 Tax=Lacinutrix sp. WUR7 TaxID=2653681 RepID=UPI00193C916B|nr:hypothetical protein [Lacinutrix sp. WUR7]QRM90577.1 hypothetical protein FG167_15495 [Lacinutrix sp. WUR7]
MKIIEQNKIKNEELIEKLMGLVFKKVEEDSGATTGYAISKYLYHAIDEKITERTLLRYYDSYILKKEGKKNKPNAFNLDMLSSYVGFENFAGFLKQNKTANKKESVSFHKKLSLIGSTIIVSCIGYITYDSTKENCMIWVDNTHYEKVSCEEKGDLESVLKDMYVLENFKRINPDSTYAFFKIDGKENLWYGKNSKGDLEYFTSFGKHPITDGTLKKITPYMIKNHIWKNYKN